MDLFYKHLVSASFDLATHFDEDMVVIEKFNPEKPVSAIYLDGESKSYFVKRFLIEPTDKKVLFISEAEGSRLEIVTTDALPIVEIKFSKVKDKEIPDQQIKLFEFIFHYYSTMYWIVLIFYICL